MRTTLTWRKELARLDNAIRPIAKRPVDLDDLDSISKGLHPLDEAGVRAEAQALLLEILRALESAPEEERRAIRNLVDEYQSFFWATRPPEGETAAETLRLRLMHFALIDQYPDPRDAVLWLQGLCETPGVPLQTIVSLRREVAPMANDKDRYGFGSTRSMLLRGYRSGYGKRGAPESES
jgi:hypothetical protein